MKKQPNFLVIMTEQHRGDCLGIDGHPVVMTPNLDHIGHHGVRFSRAYTSCASCIAARRSFLSGQFPATHGIVGYRDGVEWDAPPTLPGVLSNAGYETIWVGRSIHQHPPSKRFGFDRMVANEAYWEWLEDNEPPGSGGYYGTGVMHNDWTARPWHMPEGLHHTNWTVNQALEFLRTRDESAPFFLCVSFLASHPPLVPPACYFDRYLRMDLPAPAIGEWAEPPPEGGAGLDVSDTRVDLKGEALRSCHAGYYGLINHVDDQVRRLLHPVRGQHKHGVMSLPENTVVIMLSDHGEMLGDHYLWRKSLPYEGASRIPMMIDTPPSIEIERSLVCDKPVCQEDIMPTVLDMAGVSVPDTVEGKSLLPLMRGKDVRWRDYLHLEHSPNHQSLTDGNEKFVWFTASGREQFFDLSKDPRECHDLISDPAHQNRIAHWRALLIEKLKERPEGFSDGKKLIAGRPHGPVLEAQT